MLKIGEGDLNGGRRLGVKIGSGGPTLGVGTGFRSLDIIEGIFCPINGLFLLVKTAKYREA